MSDEGDSLIHGILCIWTINNYQPDFFLNPMIFSCNGISLSNATFDSDSIRFKPDFAQFSGTHSQMFLYLHVRSPCTYKPFILGAIDSLCSSCKCVG